MYSISKDQKVISFFEDNFHDFSINYLNSYRYVSGVNSINLYYG